MLISCYADSDTTLMLISTYPAIYLVIWLFGVRKGSPKKQNCVRGFNVSRF